ncbi:MAG TPA: alpha/beta hydrolase-fold protein [Chthoniobacteraceae bacterium]|jgi:enterochelin esterase family protein|nr:alpha/beta hydrolase-fold protein [Chthoniobacteraceae bacterium]
MNPRPLLLLLTLCLPAFAQQPPPATPPPRPAPIISPEVKEGRNVTFRLRAPNAKEVQVRGQWAKEPLALTLGTDGNWSGEAAAVPPGVWEYSFAVDGLAMIDPGNSALKPMRNPRASILHIPDSPPAAWDFQDVAHGTVHQHSYLSKALGRPRELVVYTPAGYEAGKVASYPLLVLQHGSGDNEQTWVAHGKAHWILDNLIAGGKARPMIVLMINGHPLLPGANPENRGAAMEAFRRELLEDALPLVEERYRVSKTREEHAITGLSMGGAQSLTVGLGNLDRFAWVGCFSGGLGDEAILQSLLADAAGTNAKLKLLWIGIGQDDAGKARNEELIARLKEGGINYSWHLTEGAHSWPVWRGYLAEFLPLLFQPAKP